LKYNLSIHAEYYVIHQYSTRWDGAPLSDFTCQYLSSRLTFSELLDFAQRQAGNICCRELRQEKLLLRSTCALTNRGRAAGGEGSIDQDQPRTENSRLINSIRSVSIFKK